MRVLTRLQGCGSSRDGKNSQSLEGGVNAPFRSRLVSNTTIMVSPLQQGGNQSGGGPTSSGGQGASNDGHQASLGATVGGVVGGVAVAVLFCAVVYFIRRRTRNRRGVESRHRPSLPSLFSETQPTTDYLDMLDSSVSPPAFSPGNGPVTLATKSSGPPIPAEPFLSPSSPARMRIPSTTWTARDAPPGSVWSTSHDGSGYTHEVVGLRVEIENLRRAMQEIQTAAERGAEAPPEYVG